MIKHYTIYEALAVADNGLQTCEGRDLERKIINLNQNKL